MEVKTQEQLEQLFRVIEEFFREKDTSLSNKIEPKVVSCDFERRTAHIRYEKKE